MISQQRPLIIVDGSVDVTGALISAAAEAEMIASRIPAILVLPRGHRVPPDRIAAFREVRTITIVPLRKSLASVILYLPALLIGAVQLRALIQRTGAERVQFNDFYLPHGLLLRVMGYRGMFLTFVRIDPRRFGIAGRLWLAAARRSSNELVAVSRFIQQCLLPGTTSRLLYGEAIDNSAPVHRPDTKHPTLLYVGNYIRGKGQEHAIAAFGRVADSHPSARLRFVGGDMGLAKNRQFRAELEELASQGAGADRIAFAGPTNDVATEYANAFAALNFSESESFSLTCLEASAAGLPVIATRCGGPEEIIEHEITGFLVGRGDIAEMASRMDWLLGHPAEAEVLGKAGRSLTQRRFSRRQATAAFADILRLD